MDVVVNGAWNIEVHDVLDEGNVQPATGNV